MTARPRGSLGVVALLILLVVLAFALLYVYRAQEQPTEEIDRSTTVQLIQAGQVDEVTISGSTAILTLRGSEQKRQATLPQDDQEFIKTIDDYNSLNPDRQISYRFQEQSASMGLIGSVVLSLLPILLLVVLLLHAASTFSRARAPDRYEQLLRLADLRDRGAVTEEEFQREKRRILR